MRPFFMIFLIIMIPVCSSAALAGFGPIRISGEQSGIEGYAKRNENIDGLKPISQSVPRYTEQPMTQAQPSAPDHATTAQLSDLDDEIPF